MNEQPETDKPERFYYIDNLRIFMVILVYIGHCAEFFTILWNPTENDLFFLYFSMFLVNWVMPLFFVLSGMSSYYALKIQNNKEYIIKKTKRLLVPFIFGICFINIPTYYYVVVVNNLFSGSFIEFIPLYFFGGIEGVASFPFTFSHLYYLIFLYIFSLFLLPVFRYCMRGEVKEKILGIFSFFRKPGALISLFVPIYIGEILPLIIPSISIAEYGFGGWEMIPYIVFFIFGFLLAIDQQLRESLINEKSKAILFWTGDIALTILLILIAIGENILFVPWEDLWNALRPLWVLGSVCFVIVFFELFLERFNYVSNKFKKFYNLAMPFYILHMPIIFISAFFIVPLEFIVVVRLFILYIISFPIIIGLSFIVTKVNVLRVLFGMKPIKKN
ncbi:MAG: acyltransferase [archaeon]|nr:acyltransferase [archaeon]